MFTNLLFHIFNVNLISLLLPHSDIIYCTLQHFIDEPTHDSASSQDRIYNTFYTSESLYRLSSFLFPAMVDGLGVSKSKISTVEVTAETEKEVMTLDDDETFGNFYKSLSPSTLHDSSMVLTMEDLSQIQPDTPKLVHIIIITIMNDMIFDPIFHEMSF